MTSLGSLGKSHDDEPLIDLDFAYFGATVRVNPHFTPLMMQDWIDAAAVMGDDQASDEEKAASASMKRILRHVIHADDFAEFWRLAIANRQNDEDLAELLGVVVEAATERPTGKPSASSGGRHTTGRTSGRGVSSQVERKLAGRPELLAVMEDQAAAAG